MGLTNSQFDSIMRSYEFQQMENRRTLDEHKEYIRLHLPEYYECKNKESSLNLQRATYLMDGKDELARNVSEQLALLRAKEDSLLRQAGISADYLTEHYVCNDCKDTGFIRGQKCHCFRMKAIKLLYEQSGIQELLNHDNFDNLSYEYYSGEDLSHFENAVDTCHAFVRNFNSDYRNLFFYGTVGTGKSFLSGCIAKELIEKGNLVIYFSATKLFAELSRGAFDYKNKDELNSLHDDLYNCDLLIIDDLGTELTNSFVSSEFFAILNERHIRKKSTVISTNLSLMNLQDRYSDRVFSRITSNFEVCKLTGQDIRMYKKRQLSRK